MVTAKEAIRDHQRFYSNLINEYDKKADSTGLTYGERLDQEARVAWERALGWAVFVIEAEENGTLDELIKATTTKKE